MGKHQTNKDFDFCINQRMTDVDEARRMAEALSHKGGDEIIETNLKEREEHVS